MEKLMRKPLSFRRTVKAILSFDKKKMKLWRAVS